MDQHELEVFWQEKYSLLEVELKKVTEETEIKGRYIFVLEDQVSELWSIKQAQADEIKLRSESEELWVKNHTRLQEALEFMLGEYRFCTRKLTGVNNIIQPLWSELRDRRNDYQLIEDLVKEITKVGIKRALENPDA